MFNLSKDQNSHSVEQLVQKLNNILSELPDPLIFDFKKPKYWSKIDPSTRMQLLPVLTGRKPGGLLRGNWGYFMDIVESTGLKSMAIYEDDTEEPIFMVSKSHRLNLMHSLLSNIDNHTSDNSVLWGWFLGYPSCCIENFIKLSESKSLNYIKYKGIYIEKVLTVQRIERFESTKEYPTIWDYIFPGFRPCSDICPAASIVLTSWAEIINKNDLEAFSELVFYSRQMFPACWIKQDELKKEYIKRNLFYEMYKLDSLIKKLNQTNNNF